MKQVEIRKQVKEAVEFAKEVHHEIPHVKLRGGLEAQCAHCGYVVKFGKGDYPHVVDGNPCCEACGFDLILGIATYHYDRHEPKHFEPARTREHLRSYAENSVRRGQEMLAMLDGLPALPKRRETA